MSVKGCTQRSALLYIAGLLSPTSRFSSGLRFLAVLGVFPRSFPGVLKISMTLLWPISMFHGYFQAWPYTWFLLKISAICSFSHSTSFRAEKANSSASWAQNCNTWSFSSVIHSEEPGNCGLERTAAILNRARPKYSCNAC